MAARLQREFDNQGSSTGRSRASRSTASGVTPKKKKAKVKRKVRSGSTVESGDERPKKKRAGGGNGAFNKELILR
jgi:upstream activation factor subunit UAF30